VDNVLDEVESAVGRFGFDAVVFADDVFMVGKEWMAEFCDKYRARFPGFPFGAYGHCRFTDREMLADLRNAGCLFTAIGLQSGSPYINEKVYQRQDPADRVVRFAEMIQEVGIEHVVYDLLTNSRFEREEDCRATLDLLCRLPKPEKLSVKKIQTYPGSTYGELDLPDGGMTAEGFHFFNLLYLLAAQPGISREFVYRIADDEKFRGDTEPLEKMVGLISRTRDELHDVQEELRSTRASLEGSRAAMPWGVRRSARHFADQVSRKFVHPV
jgi:hypothetical protein